MRTVVFALVALWFPATVVADAPDPKQEQRRLHRRAAIMKKIVEARVAQRASKMKLDEAGEKLTWQGQRAHWKPRGVHSFKKAAYIHAYFREASPMPYFRRIYRPKRDLTRLRSPALLKAPDSSN